MATILLLVGGSVFNVAWEIGAPNDAASLRIANGDHLVDLARAEKASLPGKVGFALSLREVAGGGILIVPDAAVVERRQIELLSAMTILVGDYDPTVDQGIIDSLSANERIEGVGKIHFIDAELSSYVIAWLPGEEPVEVMRLFLASPDSIVVLDERIVIEMDQ
jgi:hypothetical protein